MKDEVSMKHYQLQARERHCQSGDKAVSKSHITMTCHTRNKNEARRCCARYRVQFDRLSYIAGPPISIGEEQDPEGTPRS